jgi:phage gp36-like protein
MYCTAAEVANTATGGWEELAQRANPTGAGVDGELLQAATALVPDLSAWPVDLQALAVEAAARVASAIDMASRHIDTYLFPRYRPVMPLDPAVVLASSLPAVCAAIALRRLYGASIPEEVRKGTAWADAYLVDVSKGVVSLGQVDTTVAQAPGQTAARAQPKAFDWGAY